MQHCTLLRLNCPKECFAQLHVMRCGMCMKLLPTAPGSTAAAADLLLPWGWHGGGCAGASAAWAGSVACCAGPLLPWPPLRLSSQMTIQMTRMCLQSQSLHPGLSASLIQPAVHHQHQAPPIVSAVRRARTHLLMVTLPCWLASNLDIPIATRSDHHYGNDMVHYAYIFNQTGTIHVRVHYCKTLACAPTGLPLRTYSFDSNTS